MGTLYRSSVGTRCHMQCRISTAPCSEATGVGGESRCRQRACLPSHTHPHTHIPRCLVPALSRLIELKKERERGTIRRKGSASRGAWWVWGEGSAAGGRSHRVGKVERSMPQKKKKNQERKQNKVKAKRSRKRRKKKKRHESGKEWGTPPSSSFTRLNTQTH